MKRNDIILCGIILIFGLVISGCFTFLKDNKAGKAVIVNVDGNFYNEYDLSTDFTFSIETEAGTNVVEIKDSSVRVLDSDCNGRDCIGMGKISKSGESIVCIPHRMEIYIKGDSSDVDTVAY